MWPFTRKQEAPAAHPIASPLCLYNTLTKSKEAFHSTHVGAVRMYNCGPTVYDRQHIGNLSMFVFTDVLRRLLEYNGHEVKQVINITDVGHLSSDADEGEDKMSRGLAREGLSLTLENMRKLGETYANIFLDDLKTLNVETSRIEFPRASDYIAAQIAMIQTLVEKGYAYDIESGVYYDTARFAEYGALGGVDLEGLREGARVAAQEGKRHPTDFALWKRDADLGWESPWGRGFPGWHIECSAMIRRCLGEQIDIHTGGIEHIPIHHNNEIAQSEPATGKKPLSRFWLHRAHIQLDGGKLAKSAGNVIYLSDVIERGYHPLALRYLFLGAHYRSNANFSWEALDASQTAFLRLRAFVQKYGPGGVMPEPYRTRFVERINDDIDSPGALSVIWEMLKDAAVAPEDSRAGVLEADRVFGLALASDDLLADSIFRQKFGESVAIDELPAEIQTLIEEREQSRSGRNFKRADEIRGELAERGYTIEDTAQGPQILRH